MEGKYKEMIALNVLPQMSRDGSVKPDIYRDRSKPDLNGNQ